MKVRKAKHYFWSEPPSFSLHQIDKGSIALSEPHQYARKPAKRNRSGCNLH